MDLGPRADHSDKAKKANARASDHHKSTSEKEYTFEKSLVSLPSFYRNYGPTGVGKYEMKTLNRDSVLPIGRTKFKTWPCGCLQVFPGRNSLMRCTGSRIEAH